MENLKGSSVTLRLALIKVDTQSAVVSISWREIDDVNEELVSGVIEDTPFESGKMKRVYKVCELASLKTSDSVW